MTSVYALNQSVRVRATFADAAGAAANPTTVVLTVKSPTGVVTTPAPVNVGTGVYEAIIAANEAGRWSYRWVGTTGTTVPSDEQWFYVRRSLVA